MSIIKSSVINLYDGLSGDHHFQSKVSSDRVDVQSKTLPLYLKGTAVHLTNEGGNTIQDVVETMLATQASVVAESVARGVALSSEAALRGDADVSLQDAINQEASDRSVAMAAETVLRVAAEDALDVKITEEKASRQAAVNAEIAARSGGDTVLQTNLDAEAATRVSKDDALDVKIAEEKSARQAAVLTELNARAAADTVLQTNLDFETNSRVSNDNTLQANLDSETAARVAAVDNEANLRQVSDDVILSNLDAEAATRLSNDNTLQANLDTEVAARITAVSDEATARSNADNALSVAINDEQNARLNEISVERLRIDAILEGTGVDLNQLQELVNAYTTSDSDILTQIGLINTNISNIQTQLDGTDTALNTLLANIEVATPAPTAPGPDADALSFAPGRGVLKSIGNFENDIASGGFHDGERFTLGTDPTVYSILSVGGASISGNISNYQVFFTPRLQDHSLQNVDVFRV